MKKYYMIHLDLDQVDQIVIDELKIIIDLNQPERVRDIDAEDCAKILAAARTLLEYFGGEE